MNKYLKNRINWKVVDSLLEQTGSTPQQLLDWLEWGFENVDSSFICNVRLYLDKYCITDSDSMYANKGGKYITLPSVITGTDSDGVLFPPSIVWTELRDNIEFRNTMIARFKKHYKLKGVYRDGK